MLEAAVSTISPDADLIIAWALPPRLFEILYCSVASSSAVALAMSLRYLIVYLIVNRRLQMEVLGSVDLGYMLRGFLHLRLAIGFTVFLMGFTPLITWVWVARYCADIGVDVAWMGTKWWPLIPISGGLLAVWGLACVVRALAPDRWGMTGYFWALATAGFMVAITQIVR